jgi:hypothetical protein
MYSRFDKDSNFIHVDTKDHCFGVEIHDGASYDDASLVGPPLYDASKIPWTNGNPLHIVKYLSDSNGASSSERPMFNGGNGYGYCPNEGRALVMYGEFALVDGGDPITTSAPTPVTTITTINYQSYFNYCIIAAPHNSCTKYSSQGSFGKLDVHPPESYY